MSDSIEHFFLRKPYNASKNYIRSKAGRMKRDKNVYFSFN